MERILCAFLVLFAVSNAAPRVDKDYLMCEVCHIAVEDMKNLIAENATQVNVQSKLEDICNRLTADVDVCLNFVHSNANKIFSTLVQKMEPEQVCILLDVCPKSKPLKLREPEEIVETYVEPSNTKPENVDNVVECEICKLLIVELDRYIKNNSSSSNINKTVTEFCNKLPSALKTFCLTYEPKMVDVIEKGLDPAQACAKIKLCSSAEYEEKSERKTFESREGAVTLPCEICKLLITEIDSYLQQNKSMAFINTTVYNVCNDIPIDALKLFCTTYAPQIVITLSQGADPTKACNTVKLCTPGQNLTITEVIPPLQDAKCEVCEFLVTTVDQFVNKNDSKAKINSTVYSLCNILPEAFKLPCELAAPKVVAEIEGGFDPETACKKIGLCPNTTEIYDEEQQRPNSVAKKAQETLPEVENPKDVQDAACELCQFLVTLIDQYIERNSSAAKINSTVYSLCDDLPAAIKATCLLIAPTVVKDLAGGLDPNKTCISVKLCSNTSFTLPIENPKEIVEEVGQSESSDVQAGEFCELCEFVVQLVDSYLEQNSSTAKINSTVYGICNVLPSELKALCDSFAPKLVDSLSGGLEPEKACTQIKLCVNGSFEYMGRLPSFPCDMCIGAVEGGNPRQFNEEVAFRACSKICVEQQRSHVVKKRSMKKFTESIEKKELVFGKKEHIGEDWECDVCVWLAEAANIFLKDNKTEENIANNLNSLCRFLPAPYDKTCKDTTPTIVKELEHGVDPKKICIEIMDDDDCKNLTMKKLPSISQSLLDRVRSIGQMSATEECNLCKDIISAIRSDLDQSTESVKTYLLDTCKRMPEPTNKACSSFIDQEYNVLFNKIIKRLLDPDSTCHLLRVC